MFGGAGADTLTGGLGADRFTFGSPGDSNAASFDTITDFTMGDIIDLGAIDALTTLAGNNGFTPIGNSAFSHTAGELRLVDTGNGDWIVEGDVDGDGVADLVIHVHVSDGHGLGAGDFTL
jgi:Ca2+-binding RTX toxin-like protein